MRRSQSRVPRTSRLGTRRGRTLIAVLASFLAVAVAAQNPSAAGPGDKVKGAAAPAFDSARFLRSVGPGSVHESDPHGVPVAYKWQHHSTIVQLKPPSTETQHLNVWGQIYVDQRNVRPANTRVAVSGCQLWALNGDTDKWQMLQDNAPTKLAGGAWTENFRQDGGPFDMRTEPDGSRSFTTAAGYNAHFWTSQPRVFAGTNKVAFVTACSARLIKANRNGPDDRGKSSYIIGVGSDWKAQAGSCPLRGEVQVCQAIGVGKHIKVNNNWRRVVFSSMSAKHVDAFPALPTVALQNPDGSFG